MRKLSRRSSNLIKGALHEIEFVKMEGLESRKMMSATPSLAQPLSSSWQNTSIVAQTQAFQPGTHSRGALLTLATTPWCGAVEFVIVEQPAAARSERTATIPRIRFIVWPSFEIG